MMEINLAKKYLLDGYILKSINDKNEELYFAINENNKVIVHSNSFNFYISLFDFSFIYKNNKFELIEDKTNIEPIDKEKDNEYYGKIQKRQ